MFTNMFFQGFVPGIFGISHGALQFMAYEEMKILFNQYLNRPIDYRLVSTMDNCGPKLVFLIRKKSYLYI